MSLDIPLIIYHGGCPDGLASLWVAARAFEGAYESHSGYYGDPPPLSKAKDKDVYILDFSYKRKQLIELCIVAKSVFILDHHKTALEEFKDLQVENLSVTYDVHKCGSWLTWERFYPEIYVPDLIRYTHDRDLWQWKLPYSREISATIASFPFDLKNYDRWVRPGELQKLVPEGTGIVRYQDQLIERACKNAYEIGLDGYRVLCVNTTVLTSEIAGKLAEERPFGVTFFVRRDKEVWSLRSRQGGIDVSEIAKRYGGGGHAAAAGFELPLFRDHENLHVLRESVRNASNDA